MEVETESGRFFTIIDIDGSLGIAQTPCETNKHRPNIIARYPNTEEGQRHLEERLAKLPLHVWL